MPTGGPSYSPGQLDAVARERGFPDYATWQAWNAKRTAALHKPRDYTISQGTQPQQPLDLKNWFQMLVNDPGQAFSRLMPQSSGLMQVNDAFDKIEKMGRK